ncbi:MAG: hypothetical protein NUV57_01260 [archaeon]|nr:hypothetical protein [archaeon]
MQDTITEKVAGGTSTASGALSFLGGWQVCHNICLGLIGLLALIGISVEGMPLEFLQVYAIPLWTIALALLAFTGYMYAKHKCVSKNMLAINTGLIIAATPFPEADPFRIGLWIIGFGLVGVAVYNYTEKKLSKKEEEKECCRTQTQ